MKQKLAGGLIIHYSLSAVLEKPVHLHAQAMSSAVMREDWNVQVDSFFSNKLDGLDVFSSPKVTKKKESSVYKPH